MELCLSIFTNDWLRCAIALAALSGCSASALAQGVVPSLPQAPERKPEAGTARDVTLARLLSISGLSPEQSHKIEDRFHALRTAQDAAMAETLHARQPGAAHSPDERAAGEALLAERVKPLNAAFITDVRALLTGDQAKAFDALVPELDLWPLRGPAERAAATKAFDLKNRVSMREQDGWRLIESNGIPDHDPGRFPGRGNPNTISEQKYSFRVTMQPKAKDEASPHRGLLAGVALNGVVFDPGTAENWKNDPRSGWRQEAISPMTIRGAKMGLDTSNAHVQPNGSYHYHALPTGLVNRIAKAKGVKVGAAMIQIGWAADGFPIYDNHAYSKADDAKSPIKEVHSSYRLKKGTRPDEHATPAGPGGEWDGTYTQDFEYVSGSGDLDECNGRYGVTPEFPKGTYYYVITGEFPFISRMFRGDADSSFAKNEPPPGGGRGPGGRRPGGPGGPDGPNGPGRPQGPR